MGQVLFRGLKAFNFPWGHFKDSRTGVWTPKTFASFFFQKLNAQLLITKRSP